MCNSTSPESIRMALLGLSDRVFGTWVGVVCIIWFWASADRALAQESDVTPYADTHPEWSVRKDTLLVTGNGPFLLRPWLVPSTLSLSADARVLPDDVFDVDLTQGLIVFHNLVPEDSTWVLYAEYAHIPLPGPVARMAWRAASSTSEDRALRGDPVDGEDRSRSEPFGSATNTLIKSGSITRGVVAGTGRDASVESALKFELAGEIAPGVRVTASLTDEDTPILPQGTTRRLDQLDRVFIRIASAKGTAEMGDIEVNLHSGRFGRVRRSLQGAGLQSGSRRSVLDVELVGAVSRGRFRLQELETLDGVQGPYRLSGDQGEPFILIVPGSERVFLDGVLLERGEVADYTVNYHTAEITFTAHQLIGRESRVRVEFEYTTNQFTRTFVMSNSRVRLGSGGHVGTAELTYIREADGSAFTEELAFSSEDSLAVIEAGDGPAVRSGARLVDYDPEAPYAHYLRVTDLNGNEVYRVLESAPASDTDVYRVTFSRVGSGAGSYRRTGLEVNGVVFEYVGRGMGDYDPVVLLAAPSAQDLMILKGEFLQIPGLRLSGEVASSRRDANTLSPIDQFDNQGVAWALALTSDRLRMGSMWSRIDLETSRRSAHFSSFARTRDVDFAYRWNLSPSNPVGNVLQGVSEQLTHGTVFVGAADSTQFSMGVDRLELGSSFSGSSLVGRISSVEPGRPEISIRAERTFTHRQTDDVKGTWRRLSGRVTAPVHWQFRPFAEWTNEQLDAGDRRTELSIEPDFHQYKGGIRAGDGRLSSHFTTTFRDEVRWVPGRSGTQANIWMVQSGATYRGSRNQWSVDAGGRRTALEQTEADLSLLLSLSAASRLSKRVRFRTSYSARSERSAVLQEIFIRTGPERGEYVWDDFNGDGVIQLDEFLPETNPTEGEYVRALLPADSLEAVTSVQARVRLEREVAPGNLLDGMGLLSEIEITESSRTPDRRAVYTLRPSVLRKPGETIQGSVRMTQKVTLFPAAHPFGVGILAQTVRSLSSLSTGAETGTSSIVETALRFRPAVHVEWGLRMARDVERSESGAFSSRSYDILAFEVEPSFRYRWPIGWTVLSSPSMAWKQERLSGSTAQVLRMPVEVIREIGPRTRTSFRLEHARNNLDAERAGLVAWELTDGRGSGNSWLWQFGVQADLNESLTARLGYDGRSPSRGPIVHTGRFQLTAFF